MRTHSKTRAAKSARRGPLAATGSPNRRTRDTRAWTAPAASSGGAPSQTASTSAATRSSVFSAARLTIRRAETGRMMLVSTRPLSFSVRPVETRSTPSALGLEQARHPGPDAQRPDRFDACASERLGRHEIDAFSLRPFRNKLGTGAWNKDQIVFPPLQLLE